MNTYVCAPGESVMESYKQKSESLYKLIKKVSDSYGGDDILWLREYARDVIKNNAGDIDRAILCFKSLM
jgi:hypothetical protein